MSLFPYPQYIEAQRALSQIRDLLEGVGSAVVVVPDAMYTGILANISNSGPGMAHARESDTFALYDQITIVRESAVPTEAA